MMLMWVIDFLDEKMRNGKIFGGFGLVIFG